MNAPFRDHHAIIASLREQIDTLEETVRQLREELAPVRAYPASWRLNRQQAITLSCLMGSSPNVATFGRFLAALYQYSEPADSAEDMVSVLIHNLRKKLQAVGLDPEIRSVFGVGYVMAPEARDLLLAVPGPKTEIGDDLEPVPSWWTVARRMQAEGAPYRKIAQAVGKNVSSVYRALNPEYRAKDMARVRRDRRLERAALRAVAKANNQEAA